MENTQNPSHPADVQYNKVVEMVHCYAESVGLDRHTVYIPDKDYWLWTKGTATIQTLIHKLNYDNGTRRDFIRILSPVMEVPTTNQLIGFYRRLLELNEEKFGIKFTLIPNTTKVWAAFERDIKGIDFNELSTFISDFEHWADTLDDQLKDQFPDLN
jgi:hypothetical protein